jgi:adiponectin receptor
MCPFSVGSKALSHWCTPASPFTRCLNPAQIGLHYGFWCHPVLRTGYGVVTGGLSVVAIMWPHVPKLFNNYRATVVFFASFVASSLLPLFHWVTIVGGFRSAQASLFFYRLLGTFLLYAFGFWWYITALPEARWQGRFDLLLSSHQLWHISVLAGALVFYSAMKAYADFRANNACEVIVPLTTPVA